MFKMTDAAADRPQSLAGHRIGNPRSTAVVRSAEPCPWHTPAWHRTVASPWRRAAVFALALAVTAITTARAQGRLDADTLKVFGGTYMTDCGKNGSATATVSTDTLVFVHGPKRITGRKVQAAASFLGPNVPPEYRTVLLSEVGGQQLMFVLYQDRAGDYLTVDGDARVVATIGKPLIGRKFRRCGSALQPTQAEPEPQRRSLTSVRGTPPRSRHTRTRAGRRGTRRKRSTGERSRRSH